MSAAAQKTLPEPPSPSAPSCLVYGFQTQTKHGFKMQAAYQDTSALLPGRKKGKGGEEKKKGKKERGGRSASCVWLAELSGNHVHWSELCHVATCAFQVPAHTSPYISLVRAVSHGHQFQEILELVFVLDMFPPPPNSEFLF